MIKPTEEGVSSAVPGNVARANTMTCGEFRAKGEWNEGLAESSLTDCGWRRLRRGHFPKETEKPCGKSEIKTL